MRQAQNDTPILLLTVRDSKTDIVRGLDAGADDYLVKPYNLSELMARIRTLLRRGSSSLTSVLNWGDLCLNPISGDVTYQEQKVTLTAKEYNLLEFFLRHPQRLFSRSTILDRLWQFDDLPTEKTITTHIKDIRRKLRAAGCTAEIIETVYGFGYRLNPPPIVEQQEKDLTALNKTLDRFRNTFAEQIAVIEKISQNPQSQSQNRQKAEKEAHKLAGSLGIFGYPKGSKLARSIELILMEDRPLGSQELSQIDRSIQDIKRQLQKPPIPPSENFTPINLNAKVLLIDDDVALCSKLKADALDWGIEMEIASNLKKARNNLSQRSFDLILLNLTFANPQEEGLNFLAELKEKYSQLPILVFTGRNDLATRVAVSRLAAVKFLHKPLSPEKIFQAIAQVILPQRTREAKVTIVDDDPITLTMLSRLLVPLGLRVTTVQDSQEFWQVLTETKPDLLILDWAMPSYNGIELCQVVRQDPEWENLPIVFLTARNHPELSQQIFAAGADDLLDKFDSPKQLTSRIVNRLDRTRSRVAAKIVS